MISNEPSSVTLEKKLQTIDKQPKNTVSNSGPETYSENLELIIKKQCKQLKEAERLATIGQTAGMVGHDIRNPLQAIISELFLAKEECRKIQDAQEAKSILDSIRFIEEQVEYIDKIVSDLQDYARPIRPELNQVNLKEIIEESTATLTIPVNIQLIVQSDGQLTRTKIDAFLLKRILINLITNSLQAMPNGGILIIKAIEKPDKILITVQDTGIGIPEEIKPKIFKPLMTSKSKGQGFGLAVAKRLVEIQGGTISFESEKGKGAVFSLEFPFSTFDRNASLLDFMQ